MRSRLGAVLLLGLGISALSTAPARTEDFAPPHGTVLGGEPAALAPGDRDAGLGHHNDPEAALAGPEELHVADPVVTASIPEIRIPEPPAAAVVITARDVLPRLLAHRLADPKASWPARLPKRDREAIAATYAARGHAPLWMGNDGWSGTARALQARLSAARDDGFEPADYLVALASPGQPSDLAEAEIRLSAALAVYARDARGGRIDPARLPPLLAPKLDLPAADAVLRALAGAPDAVAALDLYHPSHAGYRALRAKLAEVRSRPAPSPMVQRQPRPELTTQSIAILDDGPPPRQPGPFANPRLESDILANMERWRWLPAEFGARYLSVNVPEYRLRLYEEGRVAHETRVITGKVDSPTPIFSGVMEYAIVNPSWHVPPSILKNEFLPRMAEDPTYATRQGYEVVRRGNAISIRQPPGEKNALGFIKFMFPNKHAVYLHDTPNRRLFANSKRALSHGCVRVENPFVLADFVLGSEWTETRLKRLIGRGERTIWLREKLPVHLTYFTLTVDEHGEMKAFDDIYGHDRRVRAALGLGA